MCGRFALTHSAEELARIFQARLAGVAFGPSYNIAPTHETPVVVRDEGGNVIRLLRWGLVPYWAGDEKIGYRTINARAETVREKPAFEQAFRMRRCVVPASGFYEWQKTASGRVPHYLRAPTGEVLPLAGLWDRWVSGTGVTLESFTIVTTDANRLVARLHDRMPVILSKAGWRAWLETPPEESAGLTTLLVPAAEDRLTAHPVSRRVGRVEENDPGLIEEVDPGGVERRPGETPSLF